MARRSEEEYSRYLTDEQRGQRRWIGRSGGARGSETASSLAEDCGGTVAVEYLILVAFVGVVVAAGIIFIGFPLLHQYRFMQLVIASPAT